MKIKTAKRIKNLPHVLPLAAFVFAATMFFAAAGASAQLLPGDSFFPTNPSGQTGTSPPSGSGSGSGSKKNSGNSLGKQGKVPPKSECKKAGNEAAQAECRQSYIACNPPPETFKAAGDCKRDLISDAKAGKIKGKKDNGGNKGGGGLGCQQEAGKQDCVQKQPDDGPAGSGKYQCGNLPDDADNVHTKINFGCLGSKGPTGLGPIQDLVFAIVRFLSVGVGMAVTISLIIAGIQYSTAEGNPESSQKAKLRAQQALIGLAIYIFLWSLLQFLVPGGLFNV